MSKKIAVYFKKKTGSRDPFSAWKSKRETYHALFRAGCLRGFEMYFVPNSEAYQGDLSFEHPYRYDTLTGEFFQTNTVIDADAVYDRSGGLQFPSEAISKKVLNPRSFKKLCADKNETYALIGEFMPKTFRIRNETDLSSALETFSPKERVVLKPADGFGGKGIIIDTPRMILQKKCLEPEKEYCLQSFVDTSDGIPFITEGHHDLRIIIANGTMTLAHVRTPKQGALLANVAQGGSIKEVPLSAIPRVVLDIVEKIQLLIDEGYDKPIYSIDIGIDHGKPFVFELNDQIGFPTENMSYAQFIEKILDSLEERVAS